MGLLDVLRGVPRHARHALAHIRFHGMVEREAKQRDLSLGFRKLVQIFQSYKLVSITLV